MEYFLSEQQQMLRDLARKLARERIFPLAAELDEKEEFPREVLVWLAEADLMGVGIPEEYGGLGGGVLETCLAVEEISWACPGVATAYAANWLGILPLLLAGREEQKQRFVRPVAEGKKLAAFCLTEAGAGSDAAAIRATARREGDEYVLSGTKQWVTNGGEADIYTVIALTAPEKGIRGATCFVVEKDTPGLSFGRKEKKMGIRASSTREVVFDACRVPADQVVGKEGQGFPIAMRTLDRARPGVGAQAVGLAQGALDRALAYARQRVQFGQPIVNFQAIAHLLADMATQIEAARALVYATARTIDGGARDFARESAMAKLFASDMAMRVATDAVQIFGGYGYMRDYPVEKLMRDAKVLQIYEGTNQVQRNVIAQELIKESARRGSELP